MSSILTNHSAIVALQTLKSINSGLNKAQNEISTGKAVASAKDNAAIWAISKVMETDNSALKTIQKNLNVADAVVSTARAGAEQITDLLREMKDLAIGATNSAADFSKIQADITAKKEQITSVIAASQMSGVNLLEALPADVTAAMATRDAAQGSLATAQATLDAADPADTAAVATATTARDTAQTALEAAVTALEALPSTDYRSLASLSRTGSGTTSDVISVGSTNLGGVFTFTARADAETAQLGSLTTIADRDSALLAVEDIDLMINKAIQAAADLGSAGKRISDQANFVGTLADSLKIGMGTLVDADIEEASARLQALQTQQQLGIQSLAIANQAPSAILALFR